LLESLLITPLQKAPGRTDLKLTLPRKENIDLKIYDISGKLVKDLYHGNLNPGAHTFSITTNPGKRGCKEEVCGVVKSFQLRTNPRKIKIYIMEDLTVRIIYINR